MNTMIFKVFIFIMGYAALSEASEKLNAQTINTPSSSITISTLSGEAIKPYSALLGQMRLKLFKEFPYLYDGNRNDATRAQEKEYDTTYEKSPNARLIVAKDGEKIVGFMTLIPLSEEMREIQQPFLDAGIDVQKYIYVGEVLILPEYRGQGILRRFFEEHNAYARTQKFSHSVFMAVDRPHNHPLRPSDYRELEPIWEHFGYKKMNDSMKVKFPWMQVDGEKEQMNTLSLLQKAL